MIGSVSISTLLVSKALKTAEPESSHVFAHTSTLLVATPTQRPCALRPASLARTPTRSFSRGIRFIDRSVLEIVISTIASTIAKNRRSNRPTRDRFHRLRRLQALDKSAQARNTVLARRRLFQDLRKDPCKRIRGSGHSRP